MMHVALIIERVDPRLGGAERSIAELADALRAQGLVCTIVAATGTPVPTTGTSPTTPGTSPGGVHVLCPGRTTGRTPLHVFQRCLENHLAQTRYDLVHSTLPLACVDVYQPRSGAYTAAIRQNAAAYERPWTVAFKRWTHFTNRRRAALLAAERRLCRGGPTVIAALSESVKRDFQADYGVPDDRLVVIPNAIRPPEPPAPSAAAAFRARLGLREDDSERPILLFAANNFRLKGLAPLLQAWSRVTRTRRPFANTGSDDRPTNAAQRPSADSDSAGRSADTPPSADPGSGGQPGNMPHRPILAIAGSGRAGPYRRLAMRLGVADSVAFLGSLDNIAAALAACHTAVLPTWYDPCSRFILEALAMGKPVITTQFNGAAERFTHDRHGWIIDRPDDTHALADALRHALDPDRVRQARRAILDDDLRGALCIDHHARSLVGLYERLLRERTHTTAQREPRCQCDATSNSCRQ